VGHTTLGVALVTALVLAVRATSRRRAARRNAEGRCADCSSSLDPASESFYVAGMLVCPACATRSRTFAHASLVLVALATLAAIVAFGAGVWSDVRSGIHQSDLEWRRILGQGAIIIVGVPLLFTWIIRDLQAQNRGAHESVRATSAGEDHDLRSNVR
jgi:hypothetical protein